MKARLSCSTLAAGIMVIALFTVGCNGVGAQPRVTASETPNSQQLPFSQTQNKPLVIPAKTAIYIRLQQRLSSASSHPGQTFAAVLDEPLRLDDQVIAPQ